MDLDSENPQRQVTGRVKLYVNGLKQDSQRFVTGIEHPRLKQLAVTELASLSKKPA